MTRVTLHLGVVLLLGVLAPAAGGKPDGKADGPGRPHGRSAAVISRGAAISSVTTVVPPGEWPPTGDVFRADVYPSAGSAVCAAAGDVARLLADVRDAPAVQTAAPSDQPTDSAVVATPESYRPQTVVFFLPEPEPAWQDAVDAVRAALPELSFDRRAKTMPGVERPESGEVWVALANEDKRQADVPWSSEPVAEGTIEARVVGPAFVRTFLLPYQDKPWVQDFSRFARAGEDQAARTWVVGEARRPAMSREEAERDALADAAGKLTQAVRDAGFGRSAREDLIRRHALEALSRGHNVSDRFVRRFDRPYGQVWHAAVLVDGSPEFLRSVADEVTNDRRAQRAATIANFVKGAGLMAVIGVLYVLVNAVTKGYFVRRLRAGAVLLAVGGVVILALLSMVG